VILADGQLNLGCGDLVVAGNLQADNGTLNRIRNTDVQVGGVLDGRQGEFYVTGNWNNQGTFNSGTSSVNMIDGCSVAEATLSGDSRFRNILLSSDTGKQYNIESGSTQQVTNALAIQGQANLRLILRSTNPGQAGYLDLSLDGTQDIDDTDVADVHAVGQHLVRGPSGTDGNIDSGNAVGWFQTIVNTIPVPTLSGLGLLLLSLVLAGFVRRRISSNTLTTW